MTTDRKKRDARLLKAILSTGVARLLNVAAPLILIPMMLKYMGKEAFGLWMVVSSVVAMAVITEFGVGNGLLTLLPKALIEKETVLARRLIGASYIAVSAFSIGAALVFFCLVAIFPVADWLELNGSQDVNGTHALLICFSAACIGIILGLINKVLLAFQRGGGAGYLQAMSAFATVSVAYACVELEVGMIALMASVVLVPSIVYLFGTFWFFLKSDGRRFCPRLDREEILLMPTIINIGGWYFLLSIFSVVASGMDNVIIAKTMGLKDVAMFAVPAKAAAIIGMLGALLCMPLWSANSEALARRDFSWVRKRAVQTEFFLICLLIPVVAVVYFYGEKLILLWAGDVSESSRMLFFLLSVSAAIITISSPFLMILNAAGMVRLQVMAWAIFLPLSLVAKIAFVSKWGLEWVAIATGICYSITIFPMAVVGCFFVLREKAV